MSEGVVAHASSDSMLRLDPDFSLLPEELWLKVLTILPIRSRCTLSQTCKRLHRIVNAAWTSVFFTTEKNMSGKARWHTYDGHVACLKNRQRSLLEKYGHRIANLTVGMLDVVFEDISHSTILSLTQWNMLKTLTICLTRISSPNLFHRIDYLPTVSSLISGVLRDIPECEVNIHYKDTNHFGQHELYSNILQLPPSDLRCSHLRSLKIYHDKLSSSEQVLANQLTEPIPFPTAEVVSRFQHLQHLSIRNCNMSDQLLNALAEHSKKNEGTFRSLNVIVASNSNTSSEAWGCLKEACPQLQVSCYFPEGFEFAQNCFKVGVPIIGIHLRQLNTGCSEFKDFLTKCETYKSSLLTVVCTPLRGCDYPDTEQRVKPFISMVKDCTNLTDLHLGGPIEEEHVNELAEVPRRWRSFGIMGPVVKTTEASGTEEEPSCRPLTSSEIRKLERTVSAQLQYLKPWKLNQRYAYDTFLDDA